MNILNVPLKLFYSRSKLGFEFANKSNRDGTYNIPNTIHFIWEGRPIPGKYIKNIKTFGINIEYKVFNMNKHCKRGAKIDKLEFHSFELFFMDKYF